jgi:hypothetical protein
MSPPPELSAPLLDTSSDDASLIGDCVYVKGHGPAVVTHTIAGKDPTYQVHFPDGTDATLTGEFITQHVATSPNKPKRRSLTDVSSASLLTASTASGLTESSGSLTKDSNRLELLRPYANSPQRKLPLINAVFNLLC